LTTDLDIERLLDRWLADGPEEVADRVVDRALDIVNQPTQRRIFVAPRRYVPMSFAYRLAAAAAVLVLAGTGLIVALGSLGNASTVGGQPSVATASPSATAPASATPTTPTASGSPPAPVDSGFAARATAICYASKQAYASNPPFPYPSFDPTIASPVSDLPGVGAYFAQYAEPIWTGNLRQLQALGEPASGRQAWDAFMNVLAPFVAQQEQQVTDAQGGKAIEFMATVTWLGSHKATVDEAAAAAGVAACGA
jgi:hypothetical protein